MSKIYYKDPQVQSHALQPGSYLESPRYHNNLSPHSHIHTNPSYFPQQVQHIQENSTFHKCQSPRRQPQHVFSTSDRNPLQRSQIIQGKSSISQSLQPPRYSDMYPRQFRAEVLPYQYERPIITRERIPVGVDRPLSYQRYYDIFQPYHRQPYECTDCIQTTYVENQDIKPMWIEWRGVEEFAYMLKEMIIYELRAERLRIDLALQPDFNIGALYTQLVNLSINNKENQLNQEKACDSLLYFSAFLQGTQFFNVDPDTCYQDFYQLFYPKSKKELFDQKLNTFKMYTEHFTSRTHALIEELIRTLLSQEDAFDYFRREIRRRDIDLERVWMKINPAKRHDIQLENIRCFLMDYGFHFNREEINLIIARYDKCGVGSINYADFKEELTPRIDIQMEDETYYKSKQEQKKD